jgi:hypothetical protein
MLQEQQTVDLGSFGLQIDASGVLDLDSFSVFKRRPYNHQIPFSPAKNPKLLVDYGLHAPMNKVGDFFAYRTLYWWVHGHYRVDIVILSCRITFFNYCDP